MNSWGYANRIPTSVWRGSMTVPRYRCQLLRDSKSESLKDSALLTSQGADNGRGGWDSHGAKQPCPRI